MLEARREDTRNSTNMPTEAPLVQNSGDNLGKACACSQLSPTRPPSWSDPRMDPFPRRARSSFSSSAIVADLAAPVHGHPAQSPFARQPRSSAVFEPRSRPARRLSGSGATQSTLLLPENSVSKASDPGPPLVETCRLKLSALTAWKFSCATAVQNDIQASHLHYIFIWLKPTELETLT